MPTSTNCSPLHLAGQAVTERKANQSTPELAALIGLLTPVHSVLEIGSEYGGTLWCWTQVAADDARIMSVDVDQSKNVAEARAGQDLFCYEGDSREPVTQRVVQNYFYGAVDFLFIDGDHAYDVVRSDWEKYNQLVAPGGLIALHDVVCLPDSVGLLWAELEGNSRRLLLSADDGTPGGWGRFGPGIGVVLT